MLTISRDAYTLVLPARKVAEMPANDNQEARARLGEQLVRRRIELDPRYRNRQLFADERGVSYRIVSDIEAGRRENFEDATLAALEVAYQLAPGAIQAAETRGHLEPLPAPPALQAVPSPDDDADPAESTLDVVLLLADQRGHGKPAATILREIREWLRVTGQTERNGTSA